MPKGTINLSPYIGSTTVLLFIFSVIYTLAFYYYQGLGASVGTEGLSTVQDIKAVGSGYLSFIDGVLNIISWLSPFAIIKGMLEALMSSMPEVYDVLDMLILRPMGWTVFLYQANYIISKIPTISGET